MTGGPLSVSTVKPQHREWCPKGEAEARVRDFEPLAIVDCEYAYLLRCLLCGGLGLIEAIARPGWCARFTDLRYDPESGPLAKLVCDKEDACATR